MGVKSSKIVPNDKGCDEVSTKKPAKSKAEFIKGAAPEGAEIHPGNDAAPDAPVKYGYAEDPQGPDA